MLCVALPSDIPTHHEPMVPTHQPLTWPVTPSHVAAACDKTVKALDISKHPEQSTCKKNTMMHCIQPSADSVGKDTSAAGRMEILSAAQTNNHACITCLYTKIWICLYKESQAKNCSANLFLPGSGTGCSLCQLACGLQEMLCLARLQVCLGALLLSLHRGLLGGLPCALGLLQ